MKKKKKTEFTGIDSYVRNMRTRDDHFWIPMERALAISKLDEEEVSPEDHMKKLYKRVKEYSKKQHSLLDIREKKLRMIRID